MADPISSISSASAAWGQPKKQQPESQAGTSGSQQSLTSSSSAPSGDTDTTSTQPSTNKTGGQPASTKQSSPPPAGAAPARATAADSAATYSATAEVSRMPEKLRDLIVQQRNFNSPSAKVVRLFADEMAADRIVAKELPIEETALVQRTVQQMVEQASKALLAQANQTRESVQALLEVE